MKQNMLRAIFERITPANSHDFEPEESVTVDLKLGECAEEFGDELRLWCRRHCGARWKQLGRSTPGLVTMAFESVLDAAMFRASALNDCRAVIAANNRRRRAAMRRASR